MKTKLLTICLFLFTSQVFAECHDDLDIKSSYMNIGTIVVGIDFVIKNKTKNPITITNVGLFANGTEIVMKEERKDLFIQPFGKKETFISVHDLNLDVAGYTFTSCRYGK